MVSARGNTGLESVLAMSTQLRISIAHFGRTLESFNTLLLADSLETSTRARLTRSFSRERQQALDVANVVQLMRALADRIDDIVPFLTLAIAASGATYGWSLPQSVSPSRLLQASSALADADRRARARGGSEPVGPVFKSKLYSMFQASARPKAAVDFTWKEEFSKCEVRVWRVWKRGGEWGELGNLEEEREKEEENEGIETEAGITYRYALVVTEDLNDGRYHEELEAHYEGREGRRELRRRMREGRAIAGERRQIAVAEVARLYYSSSGRLLNIEDAKTPVLVLKVQKEVGQRAGGRKDGTVNGITKGFEGGEAEPFVTPRKPKNWSTADGENGWGFKVDWLALEAYHPDDGSEEEDEDESEEDEDESEEEHDTEDDGETEVDDEEATEHVDGQDDEPNRKDAASSHRRPSFSASESTTAIASPPPLSLLEYLIRLSALEVSEQTSHLDISDEKINLFLRDGDVSADSSNVASAARAPTHRYRMPGGRSTIGRRGLLFRPPDEDAASPLAKKSSTRSRTWSGAESSEGESLASGL
ncbi:RanGTP-binding protein-domain-containing protein [Jimgerdemannia flammicorona]|uniref:RanGTP-binding protein-domain-containing protein n=1 Tax=Jimgerdemannia flammicorona TaxID=994334 RepID=A0A433A1W3_9FUNG|nr:RanGTP-binding protein-domain-containing protein [Jimgerdemannia flammicorona]